MGFKSCPICGRSKCLHTETEQIECIQAQEKAVNKLFKDAGIPTKESLADEITALKFGIRGAIEVVEGYEQMRQNSMGALSLAVNHGMVWPEDQINLAKTTIAKAAALLPKLEDLVKE